MLLESTNEVNRDQQRGILFNIFTSTTASKKKKNNKFVSPANLRATINIEKAQRINQKEFNELKNYSTRNWVTFSRKKCKLYVQSRSNNKHFCCRLGISQLKPLSCRGTHEHKLSRAVSETGKWKSAIIGFINHGAFSGGREMHKLLYIVLVKHPAQHHTHF